MWHPGGARLKKFGIVKSVNNSAQQRTNYIRYDSERFSDTVAIQYSSFIQNMYTYTVPGPRPGPGYNLMPGPGPGKFRMSSSPGVESIILEFLPTLR